MAVLVTLTALALAALPEPLRQVRMPLWELLLQTAPEQARSAIGANVIKRQHACGLGVALRVNGGHHGLHELQLIDAGLV